MISICYLQAGIDFFPNTQINQQKTCDNTNISSVESNTDKNKPLYSCDDLQMNNFTCAYIKNILKYNNDIMVSSELCEYNLDDINYKYYSGEYYAMSDDVKNRICSNYFNSIIDNINDELKNSDEYKNITLELEKIINHEPIENFNSINFLSTNITNPDLKNNIINIMKSLFGIKNTHDIAFDIIKKNCSFNNLDDSNKLLNIKNKQHKQLFFEYIFDNMNDLFVFNQRQNTCNVITKPNYDFILTKIVCKKYINNLNKIKPMNIKCNDIYDTNNKLSIDMLTKKILTNTSIDPTLIKNIIAKLPNIYDMDTIINKNRKMFYTGSNKYEIMNQNNTTKILQMSTIKNNYHISILPNLNLEIVNIHMRETKNVNQFYNDIYNYCIKNKNKNFIIIGDFNDKADIINEKLHNEFTNKLYNNNIYEYGLDPLYSIIQSCQNVNFKRKHLLHLYYNFIDYRIVNVSLLDDYCNNVTSTSSHIPFIIKIEKDPLKEIQTQLESKIKELELRNVDIIETNRKLVMLQDLLDKCNKMQKS